MDRNRSIGVGIALLTLLIFPYLWLTQYVHPVADDIGKAFTTNSIGYAQALINQYNGWSGRYSAMFLVYGNPMVFDKNWLFPLWSIIAIGVTFLGLWSLFYSVFKSGKISCLGALILLVLFLHNVPTLAQGIYWYTGMVNYQLVLGVSAFYFGLIISWWNRLTLLRLAVLGLVLATTLGFNEVASLLVILTTAFLLIKNKSKQQQKGLLVLFIVGITCCLIFFLAPGNEARGSNFPNNHQFWHSIGYSVAQVIRFGAKWMVSIPLVVATLFFAKHINILPSAIRDRVHYYFSYPWQSVLALLCIVFVCVFPPYWATGILGQHRTLNVAYFFFLIMWFINAIVWLKRFPLSLNWFTAKLQTGGVVLFIVGAIFTSNGWDVTADIVSGSANNYYTQLKKREEVLKNVHLNKGDTLFLPKITDSPASLFVLDIQDNPSHWANVNYANYYDLRGCVILPER